MYSIGMWDTVKVVGKGGSSTVFKAALKSDPKKFIAVKQIETDGFFAEQISNIKLEIATIRDLNHPNIISYLGTEQLENKIYILLEYADRGSLRQYYQRNGALRESQAASCIGQILAGLEYLHNKGIAHRDIKCANCLLTASRECKLADFGARRVPFVLFTLVWCRVNKRVILHLVNVIDHIPSQLLHIPQLTLEVIDLSPVSCVVEIATPP